MKLQSVPGYPSNISLNGSPTNLVINLTPSGNYQIARALVPGGAPEHECEVLFEGTKEELLAFWSQQIEKVLPDFFQAIKDFSDFRPLGFYLEWEVPGQPT
ncbi:MAG: hypothetical protein JO108_08730 [Acidobacteriaceae bacterium]|nr:hypothetical protein [Acidobacteriaceae bacterium]